MSSLVEQIQHSYDKILYQGGAFADCHPQNMNRVAALFGLQPAAIVKCRVLDIGCATGSNILPLAEALPGSHFLGVDLSQRNITIAQERARLLGLENIEFRCADIQDFGREEKPFDYMIAHGFYSWVPAAVRDMLFELMRLNLSAHGVGYISYNTFPGWHLRSIARDMMLFHSSETDVPAERLAKGLEILALASTDLPSSFGYRTVMKAAAELIPKQPNILHDEMGVINEPVYFRQFVKHVEQHGLAYVDNACPSSGIASFPPQIQQKIQQFASDEINREQYLDFLGGRSFKASLVCRADAVRSNKRGAALVPDLYVAGRLREDSPVGSAAGTEAKGPWRFRLQNDDRQFVVHEPYMHHVLQRIAHRWPHSVAVAELLALAEESISRQKDADLQSARAESICQTLYNMFLLDMVELNTSDADYIGDISGSLRTSGFARLQARQGEAITNLRHQTLPPHHVVGRLLPMLDGTRGRSALLREFKSMVHRGDIQIQAPSGKASEAELDAAFLQFLEYLANSSLLLK